MTKLGKVSTIGRLCDKLNELVCTIHVDRGDGEATVEELAEELLQSLEAVEAGRTTPLRLNDSKRAPDE